ncbi:mitochondrial protein [Cryptococcus neoformans]|uniref:Mitochondrial protein n=1 Tax=Cryptococcus neoformans Tu259-1 TaxID=1230072 RepID=A0A854Q2H1_CRYNE|nr:mitochondrial protein [Cryptococcus neoformans var. grubii Bt1]OWZ27879.1 mitochondrial protein [Cryptococcus neoformans var. grubii c45]OWZ27963.1 mitochondrial protein [Cryptococcus neoformans var. grubii AD1-83a]OWZ50255.1 mitochondrial protein [Cryptococcus neoformans var. grubii 125.91]OWZ74880.1 mitochondrial protein [Cryptococcus neoformans var. grubii Bt85]OXC81179.1 mitochondrial protein [Cryptococcus neoformans var. grubii AD1-7a]OXG10737.1 mitochondrial protein [Cryptococcus neo
MPISLPDVSHRQSLILTALAAALGTTSLILSFQALRREARTERLKRQVGQDVEEWEKSREGSGMSSPDEKIERIVRKEKNWEKEFDEGLIREQLTRNYNFLGEESMGLVRKSYVVVVGCGGVGSWCALMLLRSGVGRILLIDFDLATLSSLNRHACATLEDVGTPKVIAMQKYLKKIAPWARIEVEIGLWRKGEGEKWLEGADWVVDAIDNIETKADLLAHCHEQGIKVFSSMGSGAKKDPTRVQIADISSTYEDPLARSVRRRLRMAGISSGIPVVYSTETPSEVKLLPLDEEEFKRGAVKELQAFDDFRVRIMPVLGPLPAIFGLNIATYILLDLAGKPLIDYMEIKNRKRVYQSLERGLSDREAKVKGEKLQGKLPISLEDIGFVFEELYHGRSSLPPFEVLQKANVIRWQKDQDLSADNLVVMGNKDAEKHMKECLIGDKDVREVWGDEIVEFIKRKSDEARKTIAWRRG